MSSSSFTPNTYHVIYSNVAGAGDLFNLWVQNPDESQFREKKIYTLVQNFLSAKEPTTQDERLALSELRQKISQHAEDAYPILMRTAFRKIIQASQPDLICLGEFNPKVKDHKEIAEELQKAGYDFVEGHIAFDGNVAFNKERFHLVKQPELTEGEAIQVDLYDKVSEKVIRVVSDHLAGFNGKQQKDDTALVKNPESTADDVTQAKERKSTSVKRGDDNLDKTLSRMLDIEKGYNQDEMQPSIAIYAADMNATPNYVKDRLHPKRFQKLADAGFVVDTKDTTPTIVDPNLKKEMKYDIIAAKALEKGLGVSVDSRVLEDVENLKFGLMNYSSYPSDHAPIKATIRITKDGKPKDGKPCAIQ